MEENEIRNCKKNGCHLSVCRNVAADYLIKWPLNVDNLHICGEYEIKAYSFLKEKHKKNLKALIINLELNILTLNIYYIK